MDEQASRDTHTPPRVVAKRAYTKLDAGKIIETAERLAVRVAGHFPRSGLSRIAAEVVSVARSCEMDARRLGEANQPVRLMVAAVIAAGILTAAVVARSLRLEYVRTDAIPLLQGLESAMNLAILVGLGVIGLSRLESRWKKKQALDSLHALRSLAHVVDMHQLTKDPSLWRSAPALDASRRQISAPQLLGYLDYCSEILSLIGKLAAMYGQSLSDSVVVQAGNDIEALTTNLSRKIWQKIAIVSRDMEQRPTD